MLGEGAQLKIFQFMTLTYVNDRGWRVFGVGDSYRPDEILFPPGTFDEG